MKSVLLTLLITLVAVPAQGAETNNPRELEKQLEALENEIQKFKQMLQRTRGERTSLEENLETSEKEINELLRRIETLQRDIHQGEDKVSDLLREQRSFEQARAVQQRLIRKQVRAAFEIGREEYLKVVLNQEDPDQLSRMLTYYDYFNQARADQIAVYQNTIEALDQVTRNLAHQNEMLRVSRQDLQSRHTALELARAEKQVTLNSLNDAIRAAGAELQTREKDRERLEALLQRIIEGVVNLPTPGDTVPFAARRGELLYPVAGAITNTFGSTRIAGKLRWNGVFIEAPAGAPVSAVHYGRVVFSDWLRGFGLLLIINHGDGYMSLYGHNEVLYREAGDWVTAGEPIATVGDTGGQDRSGLYFEIRHAGKPTDPQHWCRARSTNGQA